VAKQNRYSQLIEAIFRARYQDGLQSIAFPRDELTQVASKLGIALPKNLGDVIYSFRYRSDFPAFITSTAPDGHVWVIRPVGRGLYEFALIVDIPIAPNQMLAETKIPDATPGLILRYCGSDEQALLTKLRYNRLIDIFTGVTAFSLQNHFRTTVTGIGQIETDEIYVGVDKRGAHHVFPVQAKGGKDRMNIVQIEQDIALCRAKFPDLICLAIGAQFFQKDKIALFAFQDTSEGARLVQERHYRLVKPDELSKDELLQYRERLE
jgi:hypothetical protein